MRIILDKSCRENLNVHFMFSSLFPKTIQCYGIMWKNRLDREKPQVRMQYGACALHAGYLRLQKLIQNM